MSLAFGASYRKGHTRPSGTAVTDRAPAGGALTGAAGSSQNVLPISGWAEGSFPSPAALQKRTRVCDGARLLPLVIPGNLLRPLWPLLCVEPPTRRPRQWQRVLFPSLGSLAF